MNIPYLFAEHRKTDMVPLMHTPAPFMSRELVKPEVSTHQLKEYGFVFGWAF